ncbi:MAG: DedA family protein [Balneolaceae bacterium]|nr:DedA family protein [Balneolaceae bacterium]
MEVYTQNLIDWIQTLSPLSIYLIFGLIAYLENIVPPIPGDLLVAFGGYLAAEQIIGFSPVLAITTVASVIGFMNMYAVGAYFGDKIEEQRKKFWLMRFFDVKYFDKGKRWMDKYGQGVILANRFLAGTRSVISITAGITKTKVYSTIISSAISSLLWNTILIGMGWLVHENWQVIGHYLNVYGWVILSLIVIFVAIRLIYKRKRKLVTKTKKSDRES